jgi:hypothetical protein
LQQVGLLISLILIAHTVRTIPKHTTLHTYRTQVGRQVRTLIVVVVEFPPTPGHTPTPGLAFIHIVTDPNTDPVIVIAIALALAIAVVIALSPTLLIACGTDHGGLSVLLGGWRGSPQCHLSQRGFALEADRVLNALHTPVLHMLRQQMHGLGKIQVKVKVEGW